MRIEEHRKEYKDDLFNFTYGLKEGFTLEDGGFNGKFFYFITNEVYCLELFSYKIISSGKITKRDYNNLKTLGRWLDGQTNLNQDNIYMFIRLKSSGNKNFLRWFKRNNFEICLHKNINKEINKYWSEVFKIVGNGVF